MQANNARWRISAVVFCWYRTYDFKSTNLEYSRCLHLGLHTNRKCVVHSFTCEFLLKQCEWCLTRSKRWTGQHMRYSTKLYRCRCICVLFFRGFVLVFLINTSRWVAVQTLAFRQLTSRYLTNKTALLFGYGLVLVNFLCSQYDSSYPQENTKHIYTEALEILNNIFIYETSDNTLLKTGPNLLRSLRCLVVIVL